MGAGLLPPLAWPWKQGRSSRIEEAPGSGHPSEWGPARGVMSADPLAAPWGLMPGE